MPHMQRQRPTDSVPNVFPHYMQVPQGVTACMYTWGNMMILRLIVETTLTTYRIDAPDHVCVARKAAYY